MNSPIGRHSRWQRRLARLTGAVAVIGLVMAVAWLVVVAPRHPSSSRVWAGDQERLARAEFEGDSVVTIHDLRDFTYTSDSTYLAAYLERRLALDSLTSVWFVLTPFYNSWRGPAHAFVSFGFNGGEYVAISVEGRREKGETYSLVDGVLRHYELAYIVGTERDLIGRRALFDGGEVFLYPIHTTKARAREMFVEMLQRANALQERPEFYNTLTKNCTSTLIDHVNRMVPGRIPSTVSALLPGYADALALRLGLIDAQGALPEVRAHYRINERAHAVGAVPELSAAIRRGMPSPHPLASSLRAPSAGGVRGPVAGPS